MNNYRISHAVALALQAHAGQKRKGTLIPYISHPMAVASIAMEHGADEDQVDAEEEALAADMADEGMALRQVLEVLVSILPNFEHFNIGLNASYGLELPAGFVAGSVAYAAAWIAALLFVGGVFIERKDA